MSRSRRKTPIFGIASSASERWDKMTWHQRWRARERTQSASAKDLASYLPVVEKQVSNVWSMGKDGRAFWALRDRTESAQRIAIRKGSNAMERSALSIRLLRKWMSK